MRECLPHQLAVTAHIPGSSPLASHLHEQICAKLLLAAASCSPPVGCSTHFTAECWMPASLPCWSSQRVQNTAAYGALFPFVVQSRLKLVLMQMRVAAADVHRHCAALFQTQNEHLHLTCRASPTRVSYLYFSHTDTSLYQFQCYV